MKNVLLIATGGTIASKKTDSGLIPSLTSEEILASLPEIEQICNIDTIQLMNLDSTNINETHWLKIAKSVEENYEKYDGFVICHGTDTLAYTASALSYLIQNSQKPIVITGSQKPIDLEITDAKTNLIDSLLFASHENSSGVNIVFGGKVIPGTRGKKVKTKSYNAFRSINFPYIANIKDGKIIYYIEGKKEESKKPTFYNSMNSSVFVLKLIPGLKAEILDLLFQKYDAIIIEAFGVGGLPTLNDNEFLNIVKKWTDKGKIVVMTTQVLYEGSDIGVYEVGYKIKEQCNVIESYDMTLESTVTKLMWLLSITKDSKKIKEMYYKKINYDILFY